MNPYISFDQFLVAQNTAQLPQVDEYFKCKIGNYNLYTHPSLGVSMQEQGNIKLVVLGYYFDYRNPTYSNDQIVASINIKDGLDELLRQLKPLSGIFITIYHNREGTFVIPDMCALREAYYSKVAIGSSPQLLGLVESLRETKDELTSSFYQSDVFKTKMAWVDEITSFDGIKRLKPNHHLNLENHVATRFFPLKELRPTSMEEAAVKAGDILQGILKAATNRQPIMVGLTAGWDSRVLLAASKQVKDKVLFYLLCHPTSRIDMNISKKLAIEFDLNYMQQFYSKRPNLKEFEYLKKYLYNIKLEHAGLISGSIFFDGSLSISGGASEIARAQFGPVTNLNGKKLAVFAQNDGHGFAERQYQSWLDLNDSLFRNLKFKTLDFFYWELLLCNRGAKSIAEAAVLGKRIFPAFNCRELMELLLSVDAKYREKQNSLLYRAITNNLWPEVLKYPVNPSLKKKMINFMQNNGLYKTYRILFPLGILKTFGIK